MPLLAPQAAEGVVAAQPARDATHHPAQDLVADQVAVLVVDFLEMVEVEEDQREGAAVATDAVDLGVAGGKGVAYLFRNLLEIPLAGDWNGGGKDEIGTHSGRNFFLDVNGNTTWDKVSGGDVVYAMGNSSDTPIIGNWAPLPSLLAASGVRQAFQSDTISENGTAPVPLPMLS